MIQNKPLLEMLNENNNSCIKNNCELSTKTVFLPLSATQNLYTQYHKYHPHITDISATYRFQQAYNNDNIIKSILQYNPLLFVGSLQGEDIDRPANALVPDYFGLGPDTNTSLYLSSQIRNQILDIQLAFQAESFWLQVNIPLSKAQWNINKNITNNLHVGSLPLQPYAQAYIYNIGATMNTVTTPVPPHGNLNQNGYNVLPPQETITNVNTYNGAYIISSADASEDDSLVKTTIFNSSNLNTGSINFTNELENDNFIINNQLNANNWKLDVGSWPTINYDAMIYQAPYTDSTKTPTIQPATLTSIEDMPLSGEINDVSLSINGEIPNTLQITQNEINSAKTIENALSGEYTFNDLLSRRYGNFNFNTDTTVMSWQLSDIILWLGYDISNCRKKHIGIYLHGVIPTGTKIDENWNNFILTPVVGNGNHYQFGIGCSANYIFCERNNYNMKLNINGYIDHVFGSKQFRIFDKINQPMSRYAILKQLEYTGSGVENKFNDDFQYIKLDCLGNINNAYLYIDNVIKGEAIVDFIIESECIKCGLGYAFSGLSKEKINCNAVHSNLPVSNLVQQNISYGYKGNTAMSNIIINNINVAQQQVNSSNECSLTTSIQPCTYPLAYAFPANFPGSNTLGNVIYIKSCGDVSIGGNSGAYRYGESAGLDNTIGDSYSGTTLDDVFNLPDVINNNSGLMDAQILNKIFAHIDYEWNTLYSPKIGILGSYGFGSNKYFTPLYWDVGCYIGCTF